MQFLVRSEHMLFFKKKVGGRWDALERNPSRFTSWSEALLGRRGAEPRVTRPAPQGILGELGQQLRWLEARWGRPFVFSWSRTRALFSSLSRRLPRRAAGRRNGGDGSSGCSSGHRSVFSSANRFLFPLPLTVCCVFDVLKQEREREQRHEQHYRRPQHCGPGPQRRAGGRRRRRRRRRHRGNPGD